MNKHTLPRLVALSALFIKEQLKEPIALFWVMLSPTAVFYLVAYSRAGSAFFDTPYRESTSWFYAYIASSVSLFGFALYIIGRRESGFMRSFIYTHRAKCLFLFAHFLAYSCIALVYCAVFYAGTFFSFGAFNLYQFFEILLRFYICFIIFGTPALLLTLLPINFQTANTLFSIASLSLLVLSILSTHQTAPLIERINLANPLTLSNRIMLNGVDSNLLLITAGIVLFFCTLLLTLRFLRINPVWSRY